ncbi:hypothetical protein FRC00_013711 [Tulasnella sp. 408]|nr:hypothetical protein FRC00_013711 [Tulasnella sp. 408]
METLSGSSLRHHSPIGFAEDGTYFVAGQYLTYPVVPIESVESAPYELEPNNFGGGVNGGNTWVVKLDDGWIAPVREPKQAGVIESSSPQDGNKAATLEGNSITSTETYKDKDGQSIKFTASATPHQVFPPLVAADFVVDTIPA